MDYIKGLQKPLRQAERISLDKLKWEIWLGINIDPDNFKSSLPVTECSAASTA